MKQIVVLDTNVLLYDPNAIYKFGQSQIVIPITVIEEVDKFKKDMSEVGRNARMISRVLDDLRTKGKLSKGVPLGDKGSLKVELPGKHNRKTTIAMEDDSPDNRILNTALYLNEKTQYGDILLVTKDINMRIKADALGLKASDYEPGRVEIEELYPGVTTYETSSEEINTFFQDRILDVPDLKASENEYVLMKSTEDDSHTGLSRYEAGRLTFVNQHKEGLWGIQSKNLEQTFAIDALMNQDCKLTTLVGKAGTGKTLLAIAAGLFLTVEKSQYERLLVSRPIFPLGRDIGYLPGDVEEKLNPWMQPIYDNMEFLLSSSNDASGKKRGAKRYKELFEMGIVEIEPLTYIRGRSIPNQFLIVDEAQNLTPLEVKTILTRVGHGSKIVFTGDPYQIDNPYVDSSSNGLSYLVERFKNESIAAHVTLRKGERSELAEKAANIL